jgi:dipeptidyl aminopeptidase/acylaminoacyl peptidase
VQQHLTSVVVIGVEYVNLKMEKTTRGATNSSNSKRRRGVVLSHVPARFAFVAISAILLLSSLLAIQKNESAWAGTFPGPNGQIAFVRGPFEEHEFDEIYVMNPDGSGQTQLTDNDVHDWNPSWSSDGEKIAFATARHGGDNGEIYVMNADGSEQTNISNNPADEYLPNWSPHGTKIAFTRHVDAGSAL